MCACPPGLGALFGVHGVIAHLASSGPCSFMHRGPSRVVARWQRARADSSGLKAEYCTMDHEERAVCLICECVVQTRGLKP